MGSLLARAHIPRSRRWDRRACLDHLDARCRGCGAAARRRARLRQRMPPLSQRTRTPTVGFALAGGGTGWGLANGLGSGRSDAFQAGVYGTTRAGNAYLSAALAY